MPKISDIHVTAESPLLAPAELKRRLPISDACAETVLRSRREITDILEGRDPRMVAVVGPCSIHDGRSAIDYARKIRVLQEELSDVLLLVMRVYFEKPRTALGWRGLILDPNLDGSYDIDQGLHTAREILLAVTAMGVPAGSEMLDPIVPQYIDDLVSWASIGARTIESQTHREMASGLSMPVGFKNGTDGSIETALNAMISSLRPHSFIGIDQEGSTAVIHTTGNRAVHVILRGGRGGPNYQSWDIVRVEELLRSMDLPLNILVDCSHGNSEKDPRRQTKVLSSILDQRLGGRRSITGFMLESNLVAGRQDLAGDPSRLVYGQSITDACIGWDETVGLLREAAGRLRNDTGPGDALHTRGGGAK
ncbi:3-deoxy-D-arabinoheptulosonate-7-phosphate synthase [Alkalispirochaeta americana]|uniref:Phospho-2-dehydro-3-deoxyheptonate aldolase n=1 Tax=Alkalispirochaeta americana TaxID=159291 RepID=A0A1N6QY70_9SPIO|nr:3-deoxy-7-phosphoheptulonate synthase [Alkalispirochaeta americana]SIQ21580.1 3-deoxy-D-arabinoheptulosonate-7-phosphate synthase [Alkalispirochaeta americana]